MPSPSNNFSTKSQASHFGLSHDNKQNFTHNSGMPPTAPFIAVVPSGSLSLAPATFTIHTSTPEFTSAPQTKPVTHAQFDVNNTSLTSKLGSYNDLSGIYTPPIADQSAIQAVTATIPTSITSEVNASLTVPFTEAEVFAALKTMSPDKSPGSDGMSAIELLLSIQFSGFVGNTAMFCFRMLAEIRS
ncbi:hypothetical protein F8388_019400 [Cannabis sativa]|uniref:Uncharacterized protein n=1 Tax=Cannabis sativa TaxID=3483 RepID=A0A7J6I8T2_CANSA|nr:hypothetical protein F8388_019400 [Cannabis sativa]KAF4403947.1 hypothetical protein G4B88_014403 [Cannabis sativa]